MKDYDMKNLRHKNLDIKKQDLSLRSKKFKR